MHPKISIVVPCYKTELTLESTLKSVLHQNFDAWECLIINDGSPDNLENIALKYSQLDSRFKYFKKKNGGLASARNYGIEKALGDFILPLDSDNEVCPDFVKKALDIGFNTPSVGVIYGDAEYFGSKQGLWKVGPFDIFKMLNENYIDACAVIRKDIFNDVGKYFEELPFQGHEDWDLWLSIIDSSYDFYYIEEITFKYRVSQNSMIHLFDDTMISKNYNFIKNRHRSLYSKHFSGLYQKYNELQQEINAPKKVSFFHKLINKIKL